MGNVRVAVDGIFTKCRFFITALKLVSERKQTDPKIVRTKIVEIK